MQKQKTATRLTMWYILEQVSGQEQPEDVVPALDPGPEQYGEEISIVWGTKPLEPTKGSG